MPKLTRRLHGDYPQGVFPTGFWDSPLWKEAARAGLRQISKMVSQGNISGASRLATTPGVLKPSAAGSQIKHLGQGAEGVATIVAHPEHGVAVRKLYDPRGISTQEMIQRKEEAGRALGNNPHFAKFLGSAQTPQGGQMHFNEYIQGSTPKPINKPMENGVRQAPKFNPADTKSINATAQNAQSALHGAGYSGGGEDIHGLNMIYDPQKKMHRVIDYIPAHKGEFLHDPSITDGSISPTGSGARLFNLETEGKNSTAPGMLNRLLGKGGTPGGVRADDGFQTRANRPVRSSPMSQPSPALPAPRPSTPTPSTVPTPKPSSEFITRANRPSQATGQATKPPKPVQPIAPVRP